MSTVLKQKGHPETLLDSATHCNTLHRAELHRILKRGKVDFPCYKGMSSLRDKGVFLLYHLKQL